MKLFYLVYKIINLKNVYNVKAGGLGGWDWVNNSGISRNKI